MYCPPTFIFKANRRKQITKTMIEIIARKYKLLVRYGGEGGIRTLGGRTTTEYQSGTSTALLPRHPRQKKRA